MTSMNATAARTDFTGVLVRRQYQRGQKYAQLVFQTHEGTRLSLSRNPQLIRSLVPGGTYAVQGEERVVGGKHYVHEPSATLVHPAASGQSFIRRHIRAAVPVAAVAVVMGITGVAVFARHGEETHAARVAPVVTVQVDEVANANTSLGEVQGVSTTAESQPAVVQPPASTPRTTARKVTKPAAPVSAPQPTPSAAISNTPVDSTGGTDQPAQSSGGAPSDGAPADPNAGAPAAGTPTETGTPVSDAGTQSSGTDGQ